MTRVLPDVFFIVMIFLLCGPSALGQSKPQSKRPPVDSANAIHLSYANSAWNKDPGKIDSASIIMREGASGKIVQINLVETEPNSSIFSGFYSISWQNLEKMNVEFYIPPQEYFSEDGGLKRLTSMIANKELRRSPFILKKGAGGSQTIEIYDSKEQAQLAVTAFRAEQQVRGMMNKKFPSDQAVDVAKLGMEAKEREAAALSLKERVHISQLEMQHLQMLLKKFSALSPKDQMAHKKQAEAVAAEALALYQQDKYPEALAKFDQAIELDPTTRAYYFQYGVTLYKTDNFNRSIVLLQLADGPSVREVERDFYIALNFFRLKENTNAANAFDKVIATKDPGLAPPSVFYKGMVKFDQKKWDDATAAFQSVLDTSTDKDLDKKAEAYIEQILRARQFDAERSKKWQISATVGEIYDSNVTLTSQSSLDQGTASNINGYRDLFSGSVRYRPIYEQDHEFALQMDLMTMYTTDSAMNYSQTLRNADPTVITLTAPWTYKGVLFGKGYKFDVSPGYESIFMSIEDNSFKPIVTSALLNFSNLFVMSEKLFSNFNLELRDDMSGLGDAGTDGDNNSSAIKAKLIYSNMIFISDDKAKIVTTELAYTLNQAQGVNESYNRIDAGVGLIQPVGWGITANTKLSYFNLSYPTNPNGRMDNSYAITAGGSKKLDDVWSTGLLANYNMNSSNVDANQYNKWTVMLTVSALLGF